MTAGPMLLACLLMAAPAAKPDGADFINDLSFNIPINITSPEKRSQIARLELQVSTDEGHTWHVHSSVKPDAKEFQFVAPADGLYWFSVGMYDSADNREPAGPAQGPPPLKILVDTVKPQAVLTNAVRQGDEVQVAWTLQEQFPKAEKSRLEFRTEAMPRNVWNPAPVLIDAASGRASFKPGNDYAMSIRLHVEDEAGNMVDTLPLDVSGSTPKPPATFDTASLGGGGGGGAPTPVPAQPIPPVQPPVPGGGYTQPTQLPVAMEKTGPYHGFTSPNPPTGSGLPTASGVGVAPYKPQVVAKTGVPAAQDLKVAAYQPDTQPPAPPAPIPSKLPDVIHVNSPQVTFDFNISQVGSSGVAEVLVYITQDEGRSWQPWQRVENANPLTPADSGKPPAGVTMRKALKVDLPSEGVFGLYLIAKSGIGRSLPPPGPGTAPHLRYEVDLKTPEAILYSPEPEPGKTDTLIFTWEAKDRNLIDRPILLEWSANPDGPWQSISGELPNVPGRFVWKMPPNLPSEVYLRLSARDRAGNIGVAQTDQAIQVDLAVPVIEFTPIKPSPR